MSLILCPECGRQVSDKAVSCPNCAYPISSSLKDSINISNKDVNSNNIKSQFYDFNLGNVSTNKPIYRTKLIPSSFFTVLLTYVGVFLIFIGIYSWGIVCFLPLVADFIISFVEVTPSEIHAKTSLFSPVKVMQVNQIESIEFSAMGLLAKKVTVVGSGGSRLKLGYVYNYKILHEYIQKVMKVRR